MTKMKCSCGKQATWYYMPDDYCLECENRDKDFCLECQILKNKFACDDCVPRGCSCEEENVKQDYGDGEIINLPSNDMLEGLEWEWIEINVRWRYLDGFGKKLPCCEWDNQPEGYDIEDFRQ